MQRLRDLLFSKAKIDDLVVCFYSGAMNQSGFSLETTSTLINLKKEKLLL
jgi:hypothetical protein